MGRRHPTRQGILMGPLPAFMGCNVSISDLSVSCTLPGDHVSERRAECAELIESPPDARYMFLRYSMKPECAARRHGPGSAGAPPGSRR